jgi:tight adherence protein C
MQLALALLLLALSIGLAGEVVTVSARERRAVLRRAVVRDRARSEDETPATLRVRVLEPAGDRLAKLVLRLGPRTNLEAVRLRLLAAGARDLTPKAFLAIKGGATVSGALLGLLLGSVSGARAAIGLGLGLGALGFVGPDFRLSARARRRREAVQADLPDALDLLAVSVEAGLGFDAAVLRLTEHTSGPLAEELSLALSEMRIGRSRQAALRSLAERIGAPELSAFVRAVLQAEHLGMSLSRILRVQGEETRRRRRAAAEEQAMKAPVKMLFPTVAFIFPSMFLVILGPALLNFSSVF